MNCEASTYVRCVDVFPEGRILTNTTLAPSVLKYIKHCALQQVFLLVCCCCYFVVVVVVVFHW